MKDAPSQPELVHGIGEEEKSLLVGSRSALWARPGHHHHHDHEANEECEAADEDGGDERAHTLGAQTGTVVGSGRQSRQRGAEGADDGEMDHDGQRR
jgi:hypothetical protein